MNFNGKYWHKPGHLGMTTDEVKAALKALPTPEAGDAGKAVVVNADADGYELGAAGGGGGSYIVNAVSSGADLVLDKKWSEIYAACETQTVVIIHKINAGPAEYIYVYNLIGISKEPGSYLVVALGGMTEDTTVVFSCAAENDYPTKQ